MVPRMILVGVALGGDTISDFQLTPTDVRVIDQALWLAGETGATVRLHHTIDWITSGSEAVISTLLRAANARSRELLSEVADKVRADGIAVESSTSVGTPWMELLRVARETKTDLIAIGPHVRPSGIAGLLQGSTVKQLVRNSEIPLWLVSDEGPMGIRKLVAAVDLSPVSNDLLMLGNELAGATDAAKVVMHCLSFPSDIVLHRLPDAADAVAEYHREVEADARNRLGALLGDDDSWQVELRTDWVVRDLPRLVADVDADLVLMAGVSLPGVAGKLVGTTAEKALKRLNCSTIVIKPSGWTSPV